MLVSEQGIISDGLLKCALPTDVCTEPLSYEQVKNLIPLRNLGNKEAVALPHRVLTFSEQSVIFIYHQSTPFVYYLLEGAVTLHPRASKSYDIIAESMQAHLPISSNMQFRTTAIAKTEVKILEVDTDLTKLWIAKNNNAVNCVELIDISLPKLFDNEPFFHSFVGAYRENRLVLPSLPIVALRLKEAISDDVDIQLIIDIIQWEPEIVGKLIQLVNSSLYAPDTPIKNCLEVVQYLGLEATCNIVTVISLRQVFMCQGSSLRLAMSHLWRRSLYVSCLSFVLAEKIGGIKPDDAFLAGLITDIGIIPLLHYAEQYPEKYPDESQLESAIPYLRAPLGALMLDALDFPEKLLCIPRYSEDWHHESGSQVSLVDIMILAKLHSYFGSHRVRHLPDISSIPAYSKLNNDKLVPDFSLEVLRKAYPRIRAAMSILI